MSKRPETFLATLIFTYGLLIHFSASWRGVLTRPDVQTRSLTASEVLRVLENTRLIDLARMIPKFPVADQTRASYNSTGRLD
jgi:hypothetical protein